MTTTYGYCRISTKKQNIERQERNIKAFCPDALIVKEAYTGTKIQGRKELDKILKSIHEGDTIIFDSVSRMSRNAQEGVQLYQQLYAKGINLIFLKERNIDTSVYKDALNKQIAVNSNTGDDATDNFINNIIKALEQFQIDLASKQIELAFEQAEKEVQDLRQRTKEGVQTAKLNGKQIGIEKGRKLDTKKSIKAKAHIKKLSKDFDGTNTDAEVQKICGISRNSYYKYKKELKEELA